MCVCAGFTDEDVACVKFGLVTEDTDVTELIELVQTLGQEVEDSARVRQPFSCMIINKKNAVDICNM